MKSNWYLLVAAAMTIGLVGCQPAEAPADSTEATATTGAMNESASATTMEEPMMDKDIVITAMDAPQFTTLVSLIQEAGLVDTLKGEGPFTVLAPNNDAFAKIPEADIEALKADKEKLKAVLTAHVISGSAMAADVVKMTEVTPLNGNFPVKVEGDKVMIGNATVVATDIKATNGVIHEIDTVLMP
ncbi:MAG: fasciclin domain-containing protein [Fimbriimonadaceae bacterium]|nr:fasciclin domain-containing protein [Fimbriimonadaceae bacterium]